MKRNIQNAEALYDGGWRSDDKDELIKEYDLTESEADEICKDLESVADRQMNVIRTARKEAGLTQQKMSDLMEIPKRTIENWESGSRECPEYVERLVINELWRISTAMKMHKYIVVDSTIEAGRMDEWDKVFDAKEAADEYAKSEWDSLSAHDKTIHHIYVTDVYGSDLNTDCWDDGRITDWTGYSQSGHEEGLFDSENQKVIVNVKIHMPTADIFFEQNGECINSDMIDLEGYEDGDIDYIRENIEGLTDYEIDEKSLEKVLDKIDTYISL